MPKRGRPAAFFGAVGLTSITSLFLLNVAADRLPLTGLQTFRDYIVRRNG